MNTSTIKINWDFVSRLFVGILFVFAGVGKIMSFSGTTGYIDYVLGTGAITPVITLGVILIEVVVAGLFVWGGYKKDIMNLILIAFTALATILFHNHISDPMTLLMATKNLAIIGGLIAMLDCVHRTRAVNHHNHNH